MHMKNKNYFVILLVFNLLLGLSCSQGSGDESKLLPADIVGNPASASSDTDTSQLPVMKFEKLTHDFGSICEGETVSFGFKFTNQGKSDLLISKVSSSCGCTVSDYPKDIIRPGKEGVISVTFKSEGRKGIQNKTVTVLANTQPNIRTLTINAMIKDCK